MLRERANDDCSLVLTLFAISRALLFVCPLFLPFRDDFGGGEVADFSGEFDFVTREFAFVFDADLLLLDFYGFDEGDFVAFDFSFDNFDRGFGALEFAEGFAGQFFAVGFEFVGVFQMADLSVEF